MAAALLYVAGCRGEKQYFKSLPHYKKLYSEFVTEVLNQQMPHVDVMEWGVIEKWNKSTEHKQVRQAIRRMPVEVK